MPTKWYHNENVILLAPSDKVVIGKQTLVRKVQTFKNGSITFPQSNITQDLEAFTVSAAKGFRYALPSWAYSFAGEGNQCVGYLGKLQDRVVAVLGFDLHNSDLPLQMEFPVLVQGFWRRQSRRCLLMQHRTSREIRSPCSLAVVSGHLSAGKIRRTDSC